MNDYDVFIVPNFALDSNFNYDIRIVVDKILINEELFSVLSKLNIEEDTFFNSLNKRLYYCNLNCLVDIKKWLTNLSTEFNLINIKSNLDTTLLNKVRELKK